MKTISKEYLLLFNAITDAEAALEQLRERLMAIQCQAEELYIAEGGEPEEPEGSMPEACCICP